jgi:hypothetical protein
MYMVETPPCAARMAHAAYSYLTRRATLCILFFGFFQSLAVQLANPFHAAWVEVIHLIYSVIVPDTHRLFLQGLKARLHTPPAAACADGFAVAAWPSLLGILG